MKQKRNTTKKHRTDMKRVRDGGKGRCLERQRWRERQKGDRGRMSQTEILKGMDKVMFHTIKAERDR